MRPFSELALGNLCRPGSDVRERLIRKEYSRPRYGSPTSWPPVPYRPTCKCALRIKQTSLRRRAAESPPPIFHFVPGLIQPQPAGMNIECLFDHLPEGPFAPHAVVESALVQNAALHLADSVEDFLRAQWRL